MSDLEAKYAPIRVTEVNGEPYQIPESPLEDGLTFVDECAVGRHDWVDVTTFNEVGNVRVYMCRRCNEQIERPAGVKPPR